MSDRLDSLRGVDPIISGLTKGFQLPGGIGDKVFPIVGVPKMAGKYFTFGAEGYASGRDAARALRSDANEMDWSASTDDYSLQAYALKSGLDHLEEHEANFDARARLAMLLERAIATQREVAQATLATTDASCGAGVFTCDGTAGKEYLSDHAGCDILEYAADARNAIMGAIGMPPNTMIVGGEVWEHLVRLDQLKEIIAYSERAIITEEVLRSVLQVEQVLVGNYMVDTTPHSSTPTFSRAWGKHIILAYVEPRPAMETPSWGYTFRLEGWPKTFIPPQPNAFVEGLAQEDVFAPHIVSSGAAYKIKNAIA